MKPSFFIPSSCLFCAGVLASAQALTPSFTTVQLPGKIHSENVVRAGAMSIETGDLDNDGKLDIVTASDYMITWHRNLGKRRFSKPVVIYDKNPENSSIQSVKVADMNNDGKLDIIVGYRGFYSHETGLYVFFGKGNGKFLPRDEWYFWGGGAGHDMEIRDMNGDGYLDIAIVTQSVSRPFGALISFNDGTGHEDRTESASGLSSKSNDIIIVNHLLPSTRPRQVERVALGDLDGDGMSDVLLGSSTYYASNAVGAGTNLGYGGLDAMKNLGSGRFKANKFNSIAENRVFDFSDGPLREPDDQIVVNEITIANVDAKGYPDAIAAMRYHEMYESAGRIHDRAHEGVFWWPNKGGLFKDNVREDLRVVASKKFYGVPVFLAHDFDRDGDDDVVAYFQSYLDDAHEVQYLDNHGAGDFKRSSSKGILGKSTPRAIKGMAKADLDGNGSMDLIVCAAQSFDSSVSGNWVWFNESKVWKDLVAPQSIVIAPSAHARMPRNGMIQVKGRATDDRQLARWQYRLNGGNWQTGGKLSGSSSVFGKGVKKVRKGNNLVEVRAFDAAGNSSAVAWRKFYLH